jgi:hypothetical protein
MSGPPRWGWLAPVLALSFVHSHPALAHGRPAGAASSPPVITASFACESGLRPSIRFMGEQAELSLPGREPAVLSAVRTADGYAYEGEGFQIRGKGRGLTLSGVNPGTVETCEEARAAP